MPSARTTGRPSSWSTPAGRLLALQAAGYTPLIEDALEIGLPNWPGSLTALGETLGAAGINILGIFGSTQEGRMHVRVDDAPRARRVLDNDGPTRIPAEAGLRL